MERWAVEQRWGDLRDRYGAFRVTIARAGIYIVLGLLLGLGARFLGFGNPLIAIAASAAGVVAFGGLAAPRRQRGTFAAYVAVMLLGVIAALAVSGGV